jgi:hypothetical protein
MAYNSKRTYGILLGHLHVFETARHDAGECGVGIPPEFIDNSLGAELLGLLEVGLTRMAEHLNKVIRATQPPSAIASDSHSAGTYQREITSTDEISL